MAMPATTATTSARIGPITPRDAFTAGSGALAREVEEGQRHDRRVHASAVALDGPLHAQLRADGLVGRRHGCQADGLLQDRAPAVARELADLADALGRV